MARVARVPEPVATLLTPAERQRVDAAGEGCFVALHRENIDELLHDLREQRASTVLVSVTRYAHRDAPQFARLVREFPRISAVALLSGSEPYATQALLAMGQQGVRSLVDVRDPKGWRDLRVLIQKGRRDSIEQVAIARITQDLVGAPNECVRFFEALFLAPPTIATIRQLARGLGIIPSTLMSRFFRAKLPPAKRYLALARLVRVARVFENPGFSIAQVSNRLVRNQNDAMVTCESLNEVQKALIRRDQTASNTHRHKASHGTYTGYSAARQCNSVACTTVNACWIS